MTTVMKQEQTENRTTFWHYLELLKMFLILDGLHNWFILREGWDEEWQEDDKMMIQGVVIYPRHKPSSFHLINDTSLQQKQFYTDAVLSLDTLVTGHCSHLMFDCYYSCLLQFIRSITSSHYITLHNITSLQQSIARQKSN